MDHSRTEKHRPLGITALLVLTCFGVQACQHRTALPLEQLQRADAAPEVAAPATPQSQEAAPLQSQEPAPGLQVRAQLLEPEALGLQKGLAVQPAAGPLLQPLLLDEAALGAAVHADYGSGPFERRHHGGGGWDPGATVAVVALVAVGAALLLGYAWINAMSARCAPADGHGWC